MSIRIKFKISIITILTIVIVLVGASISGLFWFASSDMAEDAAQQLFENQTRSAKDSFVNLLVEAGANAAVGVTQQNIKDSPIKFLDADILPVAIETLRQHPAYYSLYYGFEDGTFYQVIAARGTKAILDQHQAPPKTAWIVRAIVDDNGRQQKWAFLDDQGTLLDQRVELSPEYNPVKRPWYIASKDSRQVQVSAPYLFHSLQQPGFTASMALDSKNGVYGVDLTLDVVTQEISALPISENGGLILYDRSNKLIALSSRLGQAEAMSDVYGIDIPAIEVFLAVEDQSEEWSFHKTAGPHEQYFVGKEKVSYAGMDFYLGAIAPVRDFSSAFSDLQKEILYLSAIGLLLFVPLSYVFAASLARKVTDLTGMVHRARDMDFDIEELEHSSIVEFDELISSFSEMSNSLGNKTHQLNVSQAKLSRLVELGISMSAEQDTDRLMEMLLMGAKDLTNADGGSLYVINEENQLEFKIFKNDSLDINLGGTTGNDITHPNIRMYSEDGSQNLSNVVSFSVHNEQSININDARTSDQFDFAGPRAFDEERNYSTRSILTVPLKPLGGSVLGAFQIVNALEKETGNIIPFSPVDQTFVEALAAQAATSLYNRQLLMAQENLMDSLILLIAEAIDAKSPYTGGHCERVPVLAKRLAEVASDSDTGSFADFRFTTRDEWREFEIGAWLHDCGKIVTPEYVVDKASKLETIYNRIHEIRTRFEVLLRDAKIDCLQAIIDGKNPDEAQAQYDARKETLFKDFDFVAECNIGGEFMSDENIDRLKQIAQIDWRRNFNIHLGLAHEEALRFANEPVGPCPEKLLDDKVFHVIPRTRDVALMMERRGFKIDIPKDLYNQGEVYNLSIRKGTLTAEERFKINEHIMESIVMLEQLPLPKHLKRVPEYAGTHHETMIGTGYPRKLTADELTIPARIMAIADIFEALTASDRPYKKAKSLSEAVKILSFFKKDEHIDAELFDLFLTSGVYREYAEMFLTPDQIDDVDIAQYIG